MGKKDLIAEVKALKASGDHPADLFRGYTRWTTSELTTLIETLAPQPEAVLVEAVAGPRFPAPPGTETTPEGYPVTVAVRRSEVVTFMGANNRRMIQGTVFRGERAWWLWDNLNDLVAAQ